MHTSFAGTNTPLSAPLEKRGLFLKYDCFYPVCMQ